MFGPGPCAGAGRGTPFWSTSAVMVSAEKSSTREVMPTSAPRASSIFTTSTRSAAAANISAVWPLAVSLTLRSAPFSISMRTDSVLPACDACIRAVAPVAVAAPTTDPAAISGAMTEALPIWAARWSGV